MVTGDRLQIDAARRFEGRIAVDARYVYTAVMLARVASATTAPGR